jgi:hypothetical protein
LHALLVPDLTAKLAEFCDMSRSITMLTHAFRRRDQD